MRVPKVHPIKTGSLRDQVKKAVSDAIFQGRIQPGDPLRELELARDLRVSQATVREALMQLEHAGLVVRVPNKETIVTQLSRQELRERIFIRIPLESTAAVAAAARMSDREVDGLDQRVEAIGRAVAKNAYFELSQADLEFHRYIWERAGNVTLTQMLDNLTAPIFTFMGILLSKSMADLKDSVLAHDPIVTAIRRRDLAAVDQSIRQHIEASYADLLTSEWGDFQSLVLSGAFPRARA